MIRNQLKHLMATLLAITFFGDAFTGLSDLSAQEKEALFDVEKGTRRVKLEVLDAVTGKWDTRRVLHLPGRASQVKLKIPTNEVHRFRLLSNKSDPFPYTYYKGRKAYAYGGEKLLKRSFTGSSTRDLNETTSVAMADTPSSENDQAEGDKSTTTEAVESDIWKVDGNTLFFFNQNRGLQVYDLTTPLDPVRVAHLRMPALGEQMYVLEDKRVVLLLRQPRHLEGVTPEDEILSGNSEVVVVDWSGDQAEVVSRTSLPGQILESRMVGHRLFLVCNAGSWHWYDWGWSWNWMEPMARGGIESRVSVEAYLCTLDLSLPSTPVMVEERPLPTRAKEVAATSTHFLVVRHQEYTDYYSARDLVDVFKIVDAAPPLLLGTVKAGGRVNDKFKMHIHNDTLTVVSQAYENGSWRNRHSLVETFNLPTGGELTDQPLDSLSLAKNETLHATRFDGDRLYVVTFLQIDPLFVVDLSNPAELKVFGELEIPGWSTFLLPRGDRLLSVGVEDTRVAISIFDVSNPETPTMLDRIFLGEPGQYTSSEANWDEKAVGYLPGENILIVPYESRDWNRETGEYFYKTAMQKVNIVGDNLQKDGEVPHEVRARRATMLGSLMVSISGQELLVADLRDSSGPSIVANHTLSWPVHELHKVGDHLIEVEKSYSLNQRSKLRLVSAADPENLINILELPAGLLQDTAWLPKTSRLLCLMKMNQSSWVYYNSSSRSLEGMEEDRKFTLFMVDFQVPGEMELLPVTEFPLSEDFWTINRLAFFHKGGGWQGIMVQGMPPLTLLETSTYSHLEYKYSRLLMAVQPQSDGSIETLSRTWQFQSANSSNGLHKPPLFTDNRWFLSQHQGGTSVLDVYDYKNPANPSLVARPKVPDGFQLLGTNKFTEDGGVLYLSESTPWYGYHYADDFVADVYYPTTSSGILRAAIFDGKDVYFLEDTLSDLNQEGIAWRENDFLATKAPQYSWYYREEDSSPSDVDNKTAANVWRYHLNTHGQFAKLGQWRFPGANGERLRVEEDRIFLQNQYFLQWVNVNESDAIPEWINVPQGPYLNLNNAAYEEGKAFWYPVGNYGVEVLSLSSPADSLLDDNSRPRQQALSSSSTSAWEEIPSALIQLQDLNTLGGPQIPDEEDWAFQAIEVFLESGTASPVSDNNDGWFSLENFGTYYTENYPWVYHEQLGWFYTPEDVGSLDGFWIWRIHDEQGWLWTSKDSYPFCFSASTGNWLYFFEISGAGVWRYDFGAQSWSQD